MYPVIIALYILPIQVNQVYKGKKLKRRYKHRNNIYQYHTK